LNIFHILRHFNKNPYAMKKYILLLVFIILLLLVVGRSMGQVSNPGSVVQQDASNHANNNINNSVDNGLSKTEGAIKGLFKKKKKMTHADSVQMIQNQAGTNASSTSSASTTTTSVSTNGQGAQQNLTSYQNYDFVPGNTVLFEDEFTDDQSGEFPSHWDLKSGQAILNMRGADKAFFLTDGNYCVVHPLMKNDSYLTNSYSVEYDVYGNNSYMPMIDMLCADKASFLEVHVSSSEVNWKGYTAAADKSNGLNAALPADIAGSNFNNKWHHVAIAYKNDQMKVYVDKYRVLIVPHCNGLKPAYLIVQGIGDQQNPIIFKDFKIASGAQMYMTGQKFTDAKIVTHGINFDIDKATIRPESMGTLNMVARVMNENPEIKFEVDGHTDNTGTAPHNMILSQQRADAVKAQLITMGIDASKLTSKGFGDTKPVADNSTLDGKANNRRVEFVKQ
jgi:OOP family OmpA-OmpF porin